MTRILFISRCPPYPLHLGDRLILWHLARELSRRGLILDLLAYAQFSTDHSEIDYYKPYFRQITLVDEPQRTPLHYLKRILLPNTRFPRKARAAWSDTMWRHIEAHLAQNDYDVVHLFGGIQVYEVAHLLQNMPTVITPYESFSLYLKRAIEQHGGLMKRINRVIARQFERWMFSPYDSTVVLTGQDRDELHAINPALSLEVIPNGIDLTYFTGHTTGRNPATLLFVGNYEYAPNADAAQILVQDIFPAILAQIPQATLKIVGNAPPPYLLAFASDKIEITGRVPDVRPYLAQATAFICP
jgi:glycosyltransferase involved in cell wall biosynthesis